MTKDGKAFVEDAVKLYKGKEFIEHIRHCLECPYFRYKPDEWARHRAKCCFNSDQGRILWGTEDKTGNTGYSRTCPKGDLEEMAERVREVKLERAKVRLENFKNQEKALKEKIKKTEREIRKLESQ